MHILQTCQMHSHRLDPDVVLIMSCLVFNLVSLVWKPSNSNAYASSIHYSPSNIPRQHGPPVYPLSYILFILSPSL